MPELILYETSISGNCHKVRLLLSMIGLKYRTESIDLRAGDQKTDAFLRLNPRAQVPVLQDGDAVIWDSAAILVYLASRYAPQWLETQPRKRALEQQWLALAADEIHTGLARSRVMLKFNLDGDLSACQAIGRQALGYLEKRLTDHPWLHGDTPGLGDIACYPYVALAPEGRIDLSPFAHTCAWLDRFEALPGYVSMPGIDPKAR